mmetsp:Transcript_5042/g.16361  ORF Transcript_5042/g.16361 Transcript_5042/m.16361 type:complete len:208 (-) Transcript_5042:904-1527(-)
MRSGGHPWCEAVRHPWPRPHARCGVAAGSPEARWRRQPRWMPRPRRQPLQRQQMYRRSRRRVARGPNSRRCGGFSWGSEPAEVSHRVRSRALQLQSCCTKSAAIAALNGAAGGASRGRPRAPAAGLPRPPIRCSSPRSTGVTSQSSSSVPIYPIRLRRLLQPAAPRSSCWSALPRPRPKQPRRCTFGHGLPAPASRSRSCAARREAC